MVVSTVCGVFVSWCILAASGRDTTPIVTTESVDIVWYNYHYDDVPNDTYWQAHDTLFNWQYQESDEPPRDDSTIMYIVMGVLGSALFFIILMDLTKVMNYLATIKRNMAAIRTQNTNDTDVEKGESDMPVSIDGAPSTHKNKPTLTAVKTRVARTLIKLSAAKSQDAPGKKSAETKENGDAAGTEA